MTNKKQGLSRRSFLALGAAGAAYLSLGAWRKAFAFFFQHIIIPVIPDSSFSLLTYADI